MVRVNGKCIYIAYVRTDIIIVQIETEKFVMSVNNLLMCVM